MEFLDAIESQMVSNRLPLAGISIAALPCTDTPLVLSLHWHGFIEHETETELGRRFSYEAVPSSCLQVTRRWRELRDLEHAVMDVAWELGSWDLTRHEMRPCMRPGAPTQEAIECHMAFGQPHPYVEAELAPVSEVQDAAACGRRSAKTPLCSPAATATRRALKSVASSATRAVCGNRAALFIDSVTLRKMRSSSATAAR
jgi:hypothetical protein